MSDNWHIQLKSRTHIQYLPLGANFYAGACHVVNQFAPAANSRPNTYMLPFVCRSFLNSRSFVQKVDFKRSSTRRKNKHAHHAAKTQFCIGSKVWQKGEINWVRKRVLGKALRTLEMFQGPPFANHCSSLTLESAS